MTDNNSSSSTLNENNHDDATVPKTKRSNHGGGLATKESKAVNRLRLLVFIVLLVAGITVCFLVFFLSMMSVYEQFKTQFTGQAEQIKLAFQRIPSEKIGSLGALRVAAMAEATDRNITWPLYAMSSFEKRAAVARRLSETIYIALYPIITDRSSRSQWERYAPKVGPKWM
jgi:hypothetical protein